MLAAVAACDDKKTDDTVAPTPTPLKVEEIIASPKAAAPGDTITVTADIRSSSQNVGDIPVIKWTATGGSFVTDNTMTALWVSPPAPGLYVITVKATNAANSTSSSKTLFVGNRTLLVSSRAGAVRMQANGTDFYYLRTQNLNDASTSVNGVEVFKYVGSAALDAVSPTRNNGKELTYAPDLSFEVHAEDVTSVDSLQIANANPRPRQIYMGNLVTGIPQRISQDRAPFDQTRRDRYYYPAVSPDAQLIAFQGVVADPFAASLDSVDIFVYRVAGPSRIRATRTHSNHKNYYPTFSTDQNWLTFISDRDANNQWEVYGMPVSGTTVNTSPSAVVRLTNTGGVIATGTVPSFPLKRWNPVASILAIVGTDNLLYLVTTSGSGASMVDVPGLGTSIQELAWSPDGTQLAVVATGENADKKAVMKLFTLTGTSAQLRQEGLVGDVIRDVAFSPDGAWLAYRVTRGGSWLQLMDLTGSVLQAPVAITPALNTSEASAYRNVMSLSPAWGAGNILYAPAFVNVNSPPTPGIISVDLSGAIQ